MKLKELIETINFNAEIEVDILEQGDEFRLVDDYVGTVDKFFNTLQYKVNKNEDVLRIKKCIDDTIRIEIHGRVGWAKNLNPNDIEFDSVLIDREVIEMLPQTMTIDYLIKNAKSVIFNGAGTLNEVYHISYYLEFEVSVMVSIREGKIILNISLTND